MTLRVCLRENQAEPSRLRGDTAQIKPPISLKFGINAGFGEKIIVQIGGQNILLPFKLGGPLTKDSHLTRIYAYLISHLRLGISTTRKTRRKRNVLDHAVQLSF